MMKTMEMRKKRDTEEPDNGEDDADEHSHASEKLKYIEMYKTCIFPFIFLPVTLTTTIISAITLRWQFK